MAETDQNISKVIDAAKKEDAAPPIDTEQKALFRAEQIRDSVHKVFIWGLRILGATAILVVTLRVIHLALPTKWQFIPPDQIAHIDSLFLSGSIAVALSNHLKSVMGWEDKPNSNQADGE